MGNKYYTARKIKPANREGWVIEFRHPLIKDSNGKTGKKIRRGLGTSDEVEAEKLVQQMNLLLGDDSYWHPSSRSKAKDLFNEGIVNAFYDEVDYIIQNYEKLRDKIIPLKSHEEGYSRVLLLGSTGAGKTTLLRQIMGTDPSTEKFPATSTAKTTVFDSEIILSDGTYKGVISFYTEGETRELIKESIKNAVKKYFATKSDKDTLRIFLEDEEQRFRLSYVIGKIKDKKRFNKYESINSSEEKTSNDNNVTEEEQKLFEIKISNYLERIKTITESIIPFCSSELVKDEILTDDDKIALEQQTFEYIDSYEDEDLLSLVDDIIEEIKLRFETLDKANLVTEKFGWPIYWHKETLVRNEFLNSIRFFSSNSSFLFGKLLTPLVSGMRVQGPFKSELVSNIPKLIIIDGEGLGHIPDTTSNLPFETISKFKTSDAIVLVDDAQSPMLAPPYAVIKSTAISGHYQKLFICFTHFDTVKGDNLPSIEDKTDHIYGSVDNLLGKLESELGYEVKKFLVNHLIKSTYFLANLDEKFRLDSKYSFSNDQLIEFMNKLETMIHPTNIVSVKPTYDVSTILFKIKKASERFHNIWKGYLYGSIPNIKKMHFSQVKALARRLGYGWETGYSDFKPISDFWASFNEQISGFLTSPVSWHPSNPTEEQKLHKIDELKQKVSAKIESYAIGNIKNQMLHDWQIAFDGFSGRGSDKPRREKIDSIYNNVIPIISDDLDTITKKFITDMLQIISETIKESDGTLTSIFNHS
ncbi:MAG: ABC transporter ATP-binding protein [Bacteroidetes bacterium]|nr:ABC transporter ATP-binding protein [Bacteroidota bacterium]